MFQFQPLIAFVIIFSETLVRSSARYCHTGDRSSCANGLPISDPFWIDDGKVYNCSRYPGFQIKCADNGKPFMNISNNLYYVLYIDSTTTLTIIDMVVDEQKCPQPRRNFSIASARFLYDIRGSTMNLTIFYNCTTSPRNAAQQNIITCLENYGKYSYAFLEDQIPQGFNWYGNCEGNVVVPATISSSELQTATNYTQLLKRGFELTWTYPFDCEDCELSGGQCWTDKTTSVIGCKCSHGQQYFNGTCLGDDPCMFLSFNSNLFYDISWTRLGRIFTEPKNNLKEPFDRTMCNCSWFFRYGIPLLASSVSRVSCVSQSSMTMSIRNYTLDRLILFEHLLVHTQLDGTTWNYGFWIVVGLSALIGGILLILLISYRRKLYSLYNSRISRWRKKTKNFKNVEVFLENYGCLTLQRYTYSDVKKLTNSFKDTLGQGGYGCVFKGKLRDGRLVAVKVLNESKGKGEDFINEVATIGRTNHVNVVSLVGFCTEGTKRALVYEFMPNGSLEKFIYNDKNSDTTTPPLGWEKLYQIALGIARRLEYLHRGCNTRILHFDIKPHNILLDHDFCPKISNFGLAKLCLTRGSVVSMVGARGTIGYIAPEVCCRNFGGVSHKSDVYSYGMMVLEMIGGRKNIDATVENISEIYFPQWIYNRVKQDIKQGLEDNKIEGPGEIFEDQTAKKMIIISLWCVQAHPTDRPSMSKVVEMLEGNIEELQMPPNPFPDPSSISSSLSS